MRRGSLENTWTDLNALSKESNTFLLRDPSFPIFVPALIEYIVYSLEKGEEDTLFKHLSYADAEKSSLEKGLQFLIVANDLYLVLLYD